MSSIFIATMKGCTPCVALKRRLTAAGIEFTTKDVHEHPDTMERLRAEGVRAVPAVFKDDKYVGNADVSLELLR